MDNIGNILETCMILDQKLSETESIKDRADIILEHIHVVEDKLKVRCPQFEPNLEWMNVSKPLKLEDGLKGKLVVLDFFTYCCINCLHVLPDLAALEDQFTVKDGVVVIGVHSAKFENEKISTNILSAILRHNINHPVVNDKNASLWSDLMIQCWPTFVVLSPNGYILQFYVGEGHRDRLLEFVCQCVMYYKGKDLLSSQDIALQLEKSKRRDTPIKFPGKMCVSEAGRSVVVSDSGHNRVLILSKEGIVQHCVGTSDRGFKDGNFTQCQFHSPQGVVMKGDIIFVADTENHAIRKIDVEKQEVTTIAGLGKPGTDKEGGQPGTQQELSSPWDIVIGPSPDGQLDSVLYIAMAGTHQIWAYFLVDVKWYKGKQYRQGACVAFAGSGSEENRNNNYPNKAAFAQPSGLTLGDIGGDSFLFVADSESSTIRSVSLKDGAVKHVVGGERDPMNLFAYGDKDGSGIDAKLQHPLGVAMVSSSNSLLVADSYNHKLKFVDISRKLCTTVVGTDDDVKLDEPGGICVEEGSGVAYIADTNNHIIRILNLKDRTFSQLPVIFSNNAVDSLNTKLSDILKPGKEPEKNEIKYVAPGSEVKVSLLLNMPDGNHLTDEAPSRWTAVIHDSQSNQAVNPLFTQKDAISEKSPQHLFSWKVPVFTKSDLFIYLKCKLFYCDESKVCRMKEKVYLQECSIQSNIEDASCEVQFKLCV
ncbi:NHL repeat-containing protein 2-like isoform X2 [Ostrea edulis]|uniref:NHL repeat-containing protein 2-like isoform X2 n=1 Tax=Ostrea edulis TaxID=37623 RepID=UPI0024AFA766|nr:NHL repeat-containing protein 2-like isoform X2 [Ostrea edulis]